MPADAVGIGHWRVERDRDRRLGVAVGRDADGEQFAGAVVGGVERPVSVERDAVDPQGAACGELRISGHAEGGGVNEIDIAADTLSKGGLGFLVRVGQEEL